MTKAKGPLGGEVFKLVRSGLTDSEIAAKFPEIRKIRIRQAIGIARWRIENEPPNRRGPWPVSYVRPDGEPVYRVGTGHDIPECSLRAFGFRP